MEGPLKGSVEFAEEAGDNSGKGIVGEPQAAAGPQPWRSLPRWLPDVGMEPQAARESVLPARLSREDSWLRAHLSLAAGTLQGPATPGSGQP